MNCARDDATTSWQTRPLKKHREEEARKMSDSLSSFFAPSVASASAVSGASTSAVASTSASASYAVAQSVLRTASSAFTVDDDVSQPLPSTSFPMSSVRPRSTDQSAREIVLSILQPHDPST